MTLSNGRPPSSEDVFAILPNDIDDPARPSGGNVYDRRLLDGLIASATPEVLALVTRRLRLVVLVHMPLLHDAEREALTAAAAVVTTSWWSRERLLEAYPLAPDRVHVATPGVDPAPLAEPSGRGGRLLCVAAVAPHKGYDVLLAALAELEHRAWRCVCVGTLTRDPAFVAGLLPTRAEFVGPLTGAALDARYATADLLVLPSRGETYGMVVTEALARGVPVLVSDVDGLPEAVGWSPEGIRPGLLVPPEDPGALAGALRRWLDEAPLRARLRSAAHGRRSGLTGWSETADRVSHVLMDMTTKVSVSR
jgi:glycosyltransferase involved in cell wall biosynthesis